MFHYVYRITNIVLRMYYYGSRSSKIHPTHDLGTYYFSSSRDEEFMNEQRANPHHFKYKVVMICKSRRAALRVEVKLHNKFNVGLNEKFYNRAKQTSDGFNRQGTRHKPIVCLATAKVKHIGANSPIPEGYIEGHKLYCALPKRLKTFTNGTINIQLDVYRQLPPDGFRRGVTMNWSTKRGKTIAHDGKNEFWVSHSGAEEKNLVIGRLNTDKMSSVKGKKLFHCGDKQVFAISAPEGFTEGCSAAVRAKYSHKKTDATKQKISENHADFRGSKHPKAKRFKITSPSGEEYVAHGNMVSTCKKLGVNYALLREFSPDPVLKKRKVNSSIGWKIEEIT